MFWEIGAASSSGFIITAFFVVVAMVQVIRRSVQKVVAKLGKRFALRHYATSVLAVVLFCLVIARACYIASVLVDTELRTPTVPLISLPATSM